MSLFQFQIDRKYISKFQTLIKNVRLFDIILLLYIIRLTNEEPN